MKKYLQIYILFLPIVFYSSCRGQGQTDSTSYGPYSLVRNIIQDRKGNIWMATYDGAFRYNGKSFTNIKDGVSSARFFSLLEDRQGNLWFGSIGSGVYLYDGKSFRNFTTDNGLLNNEITCIYEDKAGNIWFGAGGGASCYDGTSFRNYIISEDSIMEDRTGRTFPNSSRQPYEVNAILEDKTGKFWLGTRGSTFVFDGKNFTVVSHNGRPFKNVRSIIEDKKGNIWLGGTDGLWRYDGSTFTDITYNFVGFVYEDRKGNIWTNSGSNTGNWALYRYDEKSLTNKYALPNIIKSKEGMIFGILEAYDGSIWFGTLNGVYRYDGNKITDFKYHSYK